MKLKAGALFYALVVSLLISIMVGFIIFISYLGNVESILSYDKERVIINAQSGIRLLLASPNDFPTDEPTEVDLYDEGKDLVTLERRNWGAYEMITATAKTKGLTHSKTALTGSFMGNKELVSLYLSDMDRPLSLCGRTEIKGLCQLPKSGVKRAYIEGQSFVGSTLIDGVMEESNRELPAVNSEVIDRNSSYLSFQSGNTDSLVSSEILIDQDSIFNSFINKTMLIQSKEPLFLIKGVISGNIKIVSSSSVFIGADVKLDELIVYAPQVTVERNFKGSVQIFASDSIHIGKEVELQYPSCLGLLGKESQPSFVVIDENVKIKGLVFSFKKVPDNLPLHISIAKGVEIFGEVFSYGSLDLKGDVYGTVATSKFLLQTPSSVYENHLLNATIDPTQLPIDFVGSGWYANKTHRVLKWIE